MQATHAAFYAPDSRPFWKRVLSKIFPSQHFPIPQDDDCDPFGMRHYTEHTTICCWDWKDRLRILVSGKTKTVLRVNVIAVQKQFNTKTVVYVLPPFTKD